MGKGLTFDSGGISIKPSNNHTNSNVSIEKLLVLKVFILAHKISSKQTSKTMALDMVNVAIDKLRGSIGKENSLRLIFYLLLPMTSLLLILNFTISAVR